MQTLGGFPSKSQDQRLRLKAFLLLGNCPDVKNLLCSDCKNCSCEGAAQLQLSYGIWKPGALGRSDPKIWKQIRLS